MSSLASWGRIGFALLVAVLIACVALGVVFFRIENNDLRIHMGHAGTLKHGPHSLIFIWEHNDEVVARHAHQARYWHRMWSLERDLGELVDEFDAVLVRGNLEVKASSWVEYRDEHRDVYWGYGINR